MSKIAIGSQRPTCEIELGVLTSDLCPLDQLTTDDETIGLAFPAVESAGIIGEYGDGHDVSNRLDGRWQGDGTSDTHLAIGHESRLVRLGQRLIIDGSGHIYRDVGFGDEPIDDQVLDDGGDGQDCGCRWSDT